MIGMIPFSLIEDLINESLGLLYKNDKYLLDIDAENIPAVRNDDEEHVGERAIMFRLAYYMQELIYYDPHYKHLQKYNVDCEYNRNIYDVKRLYGESVIPDIIIHKRGSEDNNLLVIELKTWWNRDNTEDIEKLKGFTDENGEYKYKYGLSMVIEKTKKDICLNWFSNGDFLKKTILAVVNKEKRKSDCKEMFRHACAFAEVADMAQKKFMHETADLGFYNVPAAVNSAFACEVFLKAILIYSDIKSGKNHDLKTLFEKLPEDIRNWVKETVIAKNGKWENYFGFEYLDNISKAFAQWRYIYEVDLSDGGSIKFETGFLTLFRNTLREACCELFFNKTWEEYKQ